MFAIVKDPAHKQEVSRIVAETPELCNFVIYEAGIDEQGLQLHM